MLHTYVDVGGREGYKQLLHEDRQVGYQLGPCHSREREREREREISILRQTRTPHTPNCSQKVSRA